MRGDKNPWGQSPPPEQPPGEAAFGCTAHTGICCIRHCFPSDAVDCWFYSSPFSLSVSENHKETPRCSWNCCQRDSSRIEHMALSSHTNKDVATFSAMASFLLPAWAPHLAQVREGSVHAWLTHPLLTRKRRQGLSGVSCELNMEVRLASGNNPDTYHILRPSQLRCPPPPPGSLPSCLGTRVHDPIPSHAPLAQ